jgi:hypothetical protein
MGGSDSWVITFRPLTITLITLPIRIEYVRYWSGQSRSASNSIASEYQSEPTSCKAMQRKLSTGVQSDFGGFVFPELDSFPSTIEFTCRAFSTRCWWLVVVEDSRHLIFFSTLALKLPKSWTYHFDWWCSAIFRALSIHKKLSQYHNSKNSLHLFWLGFRRKWKNKTTNEKCKVNCCSENEPGIKKQIEFLLSLLFQADIAFWTPPSQRFGFTNLDIKVIW